MRLKKIIAAVFIMTAIVLFMINFDIDGISTTQTQLVEIADEVAEITDAFLEGELSQEEAYHKIEPLYNKYVKIYESINFDKLSNSAKAAGNSFAAMTYKNHIISVGKNILSIKIKLQLSDSEIPEDDFNDALKRHQKMYKLGTSFNPEDFFEDFEDLLRFEQSMLKSSSMSLKMFRTSQFSKERNYDNW